MILRSSRILDFGTFSRIEKGLLNRRFSSQKASEPLRILFCGSDNFSIASLKAVHREQERGDSLIASIDVLCRPPKRVGRGLKQIREVAIAKEARNLSLPLHEIDTFTGWTPPMPSGSPINLIIAVSFGRFVPFRILKGAQYGGLNVHPSMLPDFHGPAPLHHTLLSKCSRIGVTVQTMHTQHFDQGVILDQTPFPGIEYKSSTVHDLSLEMAPFGADMLVRAIRNRSFVAPHDVKGWKQDGHEGLIRHAPKITPENSHIDWSSWTANDILHKQSIIGPLWNFVERSPRKFPRERRVIWSAGLTKAAPMPSHEPGEPYAIGHPDQKLTIYVNTSDGQVLKAEHLTLDGEHEKASKTALGNQGLGRPTACDENDESAQVLHFA